MEISLSLNRILDRIDYTRFEGELDVRAITGIASIAEARKGDLTFVSGLKYADQLATTKASLVILGEEINVKPRHGQLFLRVKNPSLEVAKACELVADSMWKRPRPGVSGMADISQRAFVHPSASIASFVTVEEGASIAPDCVVGPGCFIGRDSTLGEGAWLSSNVTVERDTLIGKRARLHSGVVLGSDGFGYEFEEGRQRKIPQVGRVIVGDDVEIGANTTVDRGRLGPTRIGEGSKIDNLVQIGHNVEIGKHCILCAQVGIAGSVRIGDYVVMGGRAGAAGHLEIGSQAQLAGQCVAYSDLAGKTKYGGAPAVPLVAYQRIAILTRRLPDLFKRLKCLEDQLLVE